MKLETVREAYMRAETIYNTACTMEEGPERDRLIDQARALHDTTCAEVNACGPVFADVAGIYYKSMNRGNVVPDIDHSPYNATPAEVVAIFRENGIKRFTMSSTWTDATKTAWAFVEAGCRLDGMQTVFIDGVNFWTNEYKTGPAFVFYID